MGRRDRNKKYTAGETMNEENNSSPMQAQDGKANANNVSQQNSEGDTGLSQKHKTTTK